MPLARAMDLDALPLAGDPGAVGMGNPHCVFVVPDAEAVDLAAIGPRIEHDPLFPERTNVEFVQVIDRETIRMRVWERGGMITLACGSGACAAAVVTARRGLTGRRVTVRLDGGELGIDWREDGVWMTGPTALRLRGAAVAGVPRGAAGVSAPVFETFGCRLNAYETEAMKGLAEAAGVGDVVVVNSCAVTAEAVRQARQRIRRLRQANPEARVVVTGCAAQTEPGTFAAMPEVDLVLGNAEKLRPEAWAQACRRRERRGGRRHHGGARGRRRRWWTGSARGRGPMCRCRTAATTAAPSASSPTGGATRAACRRRRWSSRSRGWWTAGFNEVVLTGVDLTSWGADLEGAGAAGRSGGGDPAAVPDLPRLRLSSIDSIEADPRLIEAIAGEPRLMPHLHLSLQAGDDLILKRMKRRHLRDDAIAFCEEVRAARPEIVFGADIIAGFPTETEAMFERSLELVEDCGLTWLHVFPFSPRAGTPAARMPQVAAARDPRAGARGCGRSGAARVRGASGGNAGAAGAAADGAPRPRAGPKASPGRGSPGAHARAAILPRRGHRRAGRDAARRGGLTPHIRLLRLRSPPPAPRRRRR